MKLHQFRIEYNAEHDRLLASISTGEGKEVLLWLTRRCVRRLWPLLLHLARSGPEIARQANAEARAALLGMRHERALQAADFSRPYEGARERPLGAEPMLVTRMQTRRDRRGHSVLSLLPAAGEGVHLTLDEGLLHAVCRLLQTAVAKSDWDIALSFPRAAVAGETAETRTIN